MPTTPALLDILSVQTMANGRLYLRFSDETAGEFDAAWLAGKSGALLEPLRSPAYFARAFVDGGGLCWPNGLELSPETVQSWLRDHDMVTDTHRAA
ncbi:MAG: DUF2442 domain-containing protein [Myxococcota bacterium]